MAYVDPLGWQRPTVHLFDAEADSIARFRHLQPRMTFARKVEDGGQSARQYVAETAVIITRKARLRCHGEKWPRTILVGPP